MATIETRCTPEGVTTYRVRVRRKGVPGQTRSFARLTDAKRWATQTEGAVLEGRHFPSSQAKRYNLARAIQRYRDEILCDKPKNARNTESHLDWWTKQIGTYSLADVTPQVVIRCRDELRAGTYKHGKQTKKRSGATVIRYMAALSHVFTVAMKEWQWIDDNPFRKVSKPKAAPGRMRYLSDDERSSLIAACKVSKSSALLDIVVLALSTGMRLSEICTLRWSDIHLDRGWLTLELTKNGDRRGLPIAGYALELLTKRHTERPDGVEHVFPGQKEGHPIEIKKAWKTAIRKAELENFRFHDLRHSAASYLAMNGASPVEIAAVLGHRTLQMVKRYAHVANDHTSKLVRSMNEKIFPGTSTC